MQKMQQGDPKQEAMFQAELADKRGAAEQKESAAAKNYVDAGIAGIQALQAFMGPQPVGPGGMPQQSPQPMGPPGIQ